MGTIYRDYIITQSYPCEEDKRYWQIGLLDFQRDQYDKKWKSASKVNRNRIKINLNV